MDHKRHGRIRPLEAMIPSIFSCASLFDLKNPIFTAPFEISEEAATITKETPNTDKNFTFVEVWRGRHRQNRLGWS